jgi:hypothetical protein
VLWTIIVIIFIIWLLSVLLGQSYNNNQPYGGNWIHTLIVVVVILVILHLLGVL